MVQVLKRSASQVEDKKTEIEFKSINKSKVLGVISQSREFDIKRGSILLQKVINCNGALNKNPMDSELAITLEKAKESEKNVRKRDIKGFQKKYMSVKSQIKDAQNRVKATKKRIKEIKQALKDCHEHSCKSSSSSSSDSD